MRQNKIDEAVTDCYQRLFEASTPQGDFDKLVEEAEIDERGQKVIPYMDYEIEEDVMDNIVEDIIGEYKIPKYLEEKFKITICLGCSPKTKQKL